MRRSWWIARWPTATGFEGRFLGYDTKLASIYVQPTVGYQVKDWLKVGLGVAYIHSTVDLRQRVDLSTQPVPTQAFTFAALGIPTGTDFADGKVSASGSGMPPCVWIVHAGQSALSGRSLLVGKTLALKPFVCRQYEFVLNTR